MENDKISIFDSVEDPRVKGRCSHSLASVLFIATCTLLCNGEDFIDMEEYGLANEDWLKDYIHLPNGIPTHDTFNRVLQKIDPKELEAVLYDDGKDLLKQITEKHIVIDGKKIKGASPKSRGNKGLYILNAWCSKDNLCLSQLRIEDKKNEISAIPEILDIIDLKNSIVSIDAIGCQRKIASQIKSKSGDYILAVKSNQKDLQEELKEIFKYTNTNTTTSAIEFEKDHGRVESRECNVVDAQDHLSPQLKTKWPTVKNLIKINSIRIIKEQKMESERYYITSLEDKETKQLNALIRDHWSVENQLHWHLDVTFNEEDSRIRTGHAPENMNILRKLALAKIRNQNDKKSLKKRRYRESLDTKYLMQIIAN